MTTSDPSVRAFPAGFVWGASTAAYQIEGAVDEDGRGTSIWDAFSHTPGAIHGGDTGDVAADHYHRVAEDVEIMAELGLTAYRFSVAWPRVQPTGAGAVNHAGLDFYSRLVDRLLEHDIDPIATLYHWDLPQALQDSGGWAARDTAKRFADYARIVGDVLGDRVSTVTTLNEPWCSAFLGYATGIHAPGLNDPATALAAVHHLLLGHGLAVAALRTALPTSTQVSLTLNLAVVRAASPSDADQGAARHVDGLANRIFLEPIRNGRYPDDIVEDMRGVTDWSYVQDGDLDAIAAPIDVLGVNYYSPTLIAAPTPDGAAQVTRRWMNDPSGDPGTSLWPGSDRALSVPQDGPYTAMHWRIEPASLTELLLRMHRDYPGLPMLITESGAAFDDVPGVDGAVHDADRVSYLQDHVAAVRTAIDAGADVRGYFVWSLLDNFEWAWGYSKRFGIVRVDYVTQERRWKDSAHWYRTVIAANGLPD